MQKARCHPIKGLQPLVSVRFQVLFHSLFQGAFHLSFTVLVHYRSLRSIQPCQDGPGRFPQNFTGSVVLRILLGNGFISCTGLSPSLELLSRSFHYKSIVHIVVLQPQPCLNKTGLGCSLFARHYQGNNYCFLFHRVLRCFSSPGQLPFGCYTFSITGCPIRKSSDRFIFADPRSLSQLIASFIASESQGIRHTLLFTFLTCNFYYLLSYVFSSNMSKNE